MTKHALLKQILQYDTDEAFEDGLDFCETRHSTHPAARFGTLYFQARILIETSYRYSYAASLFERGSRGFHGESALDILIKEYFALCIELTGIDRAVYNNDERLLEQNIQTIQTALQKLRTLLKGPLSMEETKLAEGFIAPGVDNYTLYIQAMAVIAKLYTKRWDKEALQSLYNANIDNLLALKSRIENTKGFAIPGSEIKSHLDTIKAFLQLPVQQVPVIQSGALFFQYYGVCKDRAPDDQTLRKLGFHPSPMADIWEVMAKQEALGLWHRSCERFSLVYKDHIIELQCSLQYNTLGVFTVQYAIDLANLPMDCYRFLLNLGMPFALDEKLHFATGGTKHLELKAHARELFDDLCKQLPRPLIYDTDTSYHCISTINNFHDMDMQTFKQNTFFHALGVYPYEIRTSMDDWIKKKTMQFNTDLTDYGLNADEVYTTNQYVTQIITTGHPLWVAMQEKESIEMAATLLHFLILTKNDLFMQLKELTATDYTAVHSDPKKLLALSEEKSNRFMQIEQKIMDFIELIENGSFLIYPDHTQRMRQIFKHMGFYEKKKELSNILKRLAFENNTLKERIEKIDKRIRQKKADKINFIIEVAMTMLSVAAIIDFYGIIEDVAAHFAVDEALSFQVLSQEGLFWDLGKFGFLIFMIVTLFILLKNQKKYDEK